MEKYKVVFKKSVRKDLSNIPQMDIKRLLNRIGLLADNPRAEGCIKLTGEDKYRVRVGLYRIIYQIRDQELVVSVIKIGHRSSVYRLS